VVERRHWIGTPEGEEGGVRLDYFADAESRPAGKKAVSDSTIQASRPPAGTIGGAWFVSVALDVTKHNCERGKETQS
jgi:hypothetical protein